VAVTVLAAWARSAEGTDDEDRPIELVDARAEELAAAARRQGEDPLAFIADRGLFGDLVDDERFAVTYRTALESLRTRGTRATLEAAVRG
jgi:mannitol 2-dehydrogenase